MHLHLEAAFYKGVKPLIYEYIYPDVGGQAISLSSQQASSKCFRCAAPHIVHPPFLLHVWQSRVCLCVCSTHSTHVVWHAQVQGIRAAPPGRW